MKLKSPKLIATFITGLVIVLVSLVQLLPSLAPGFELFERLEWISYDLRVRQAFKHPGPVSPNLGAVFIDDDGIQLVNEQLGFSFPWPRKLHGMVVKELTDQGARAIGFDILFGELHPPNPEIDIELPNGATLRSDEYFGMQLRRSGKTVLAAFGESSAGQWQALMPAELFRTNALTVAHATSDYDSDGVLRRAVAYKDDPVHGRLWHMGIILAAQELGLDLNNPEIKPGRIMLRGEGGVERVIPVDKDGSFYVDWGIQWNDPRIEKTGFHDLLGESDYQPDWKDKLVVIGSIGSGNNISDVGSTALDKTTYLVSKHWNVANTLLTGRFVQRSSLGATLLLIALMGSLAGVLTWKLKAPWPSLAVVAVAVAYIAAAFWLYVQYRLWIPIVLPVFCALLMNHVALVTYQMLFEQKEKRRVKGVFSKLVSPNVVNELLGSERLNLGGSRRRITVFFSDVRGFTQMTDLYQAKAEEYVRQNQLPTEAAEAYHDDSARQTLATVNIYLSTIADMVKKHKGTLDKYMGDCVMAFWGAPTPNEQHALYCVRAAIEAQRAMYVLNQERAAHNKRIEQENLEREKAGLPALHPLTLLTLGTGINTGISIVGLMGSDAHILNYTVFGREVNLASRLEGVSGRGRIIISESTYQDLQRDDPELAAKCVEQPAVMVKGIKDAVRIFEVPWKDGLEKPAESPAPAKVTAPETTAQPAASKP